MVVKWTAADFRKYEARGGANKPYVVNFCHNWRLTCIDLKKVFRETADSFNGVANFVSIDCETEAQLCDQQGTASTPHVMLYDKAKMLSDRFLGAGPDVAMPPTVAGITDWIETASSSEVVQMTLPGFQNDVKQGVDTWLIAFSAGEDDHHSSKRSLKILHSRLHLHNML